MGTPRFRVTIAATVTLPAAFIKNGVPDETLLVKFAAFKIQRQVGMLGYPLGQLAPNVEWKYEAVDSDLARQDPTAQSSLEDKP
jgi:hypothetical protein